MLKFAQFLEERNVNMARYVPRVLRLKKFKVALRPDAETGEKTYQVPIPGYKDEHFDKYDSAENQVYNKFSKTSPSKDPLDTTDHVYNNLNKHAVRQTVNVKDLLPTQDYVSFRNGQELKNKLGDTSRSISVAKINGKHYIRDGHHAVAAALLRGDKTISADVHDYNDILGKKKIN